MVGRAIAVSIRTVRLVVATYIVVFLLATVWPGAVLFNHVQPLILGLPFNLFIIALLIVGALGMLAMLYVSEQRRDGE